MKFQFLKEVSLIWIHLCWLISRTNGVTVNRPGPSAKNTSHQNSSTTHGAARGVTTPHHPTSTRQGGEATNPSTEFDYDGGTEWSVSKFPTSPPRSFGPIFRNETTPKDIEQKLRESKIIPDILLKAPKNLVEITYDKKRSVYLGNLYSCLQVDNPPIFVEWPCDPKSFYTLILTDPDSPTPEDPYQREFHHWIVGNIPGCHVRAGVTLSEYITPLPITYAGTHRYVFLVYKQDKGRIKFNWEHRDHRPIDALRGDFNSEEFARNHSMSGPVAINYFTANWEMTNTPLPGDEKWLTTKDFFEDFGE